jgi:hypothetical protein
MAQTVATSPRRSGRTVSVGPCFGLRARVCIDSSDPQRRPRGIGWARRLTGLSGTVNRTLAPPDPPLFDPARHEPITEAAWDEARALDAIRAIVAETEAAFSPDSLWPPHPLDEEDDEPPLDAPPGVYLGAAGVIWALTRLDVAGVAGSWTNWAEVAATLPDRYRAHPDFPDGVVPGLLLGEAGILLIANRLAPERGQEEALLEVVRGNVDNPALELMWGAPGTMLAAAVMHERDGRGAWEEAWRESADAVWAAWDDDVWEQIMLGRPSHVLGAAHGFAGNVYALARGPFLDDARRAELERRTIEVVEKHARRADGLLQWPESLEWPRPGRPVEVRTQWCHGAPGLVTSLAALAPKSDRLTELLVEAGELTWQAGPLATGWGLCHGTAGNGYAFLKLLERTGDELWLERARAFATHALEQVERKRAEHGRGRFSLWTGDPGVAVYVASCLDASAAIPTLDDL